MLGTAVDHLLNLYRVLPGRRAVVLTAGDQGYATAVALREAGASAIVVDLRPAPAGPEVDSAVEPGSAAARATVLDRIAFAAVVVRQQVFDPGPVFPGQCIAPSVPDAFQAHSPISIPDPPCS